MGTGGNTAMQGVGAGLRVQCTARGSVRTEPFLPSWDNVLIYVNNTPPPLPFVT